jgi:hypothetical protein
VAPAGLWQAQGKGEWGSAPEAWPALQFEANYQPKTKSEERSQLSSLPFRWLGLQTRLGRIQAGGLEAQEFDESVRIGPLDFGNATPHASEHRGALSLNFVSFGHWCADPSYLP